MSNDSAIYFAKINLRKFSEGIQLSTTHVAYSLRKFAAC